MGNSVLIKRIGAYIIDYLFIFLLLTMLNQIRFLNPTYDEYMQVYDNYLEIMDGLTVDNAIEIAESAEFREVNYDLSKYSVSISIISVVIYIAYFWGFQMWNKNQTLGKKMFNIQVVGKDDNKPRWWQMLLRSVILYNLWLEALLIISLFIFDSNGYIWVSSVLSVVSTVILFVTAFMVLFRKDGRGLHDIIANTKVVVKEIENGN